MKKYISLLLVTLLVFCLAGCSSDYERGMTAFNTGDYKTALEHFEKAENEEEVKDWVEVSKKALEFENLYVGSTITLGHFEQDNLTTNGEEEIEWIVLGKESDRMLVISKYVLGKCYTGDFKGTWENSTVREYFNDTFLNDVFNEAEKSLINTTHLTTPYNQELQIEGGKDTDDKIFLLSYEQAKTYFADNSSRICECTPYASETDAGFNVWINGDYVERGWWSLRTMGVNGGFSNVIQNGQVSLNGDIYVYYRPAMWLKIS